MTPYDEIHERLSQLLDGREGFSSRVLFDFGEAGALLIDGSLGKIAVTKGAADAACTIAMPAETFVRILAGELDESSAFMHGEMRITGEVGLATAISDLIRRRAQAQAAAQEDAEAG